MINISLKTIELLIASISFLFVYIISICFVGYFRTWLADKMGDSTAKDAGFLTLNPIVHIDIMGMMMLVFFYFGWGRHIPVNPYNIIGPYSKLKRFIAYFADVFAYFFVALICLVALLIVFDEHILAVTRHMILYGDISHFYVARIYPDYTSLLISLGFIGVAFVYFNMVFGVIRLITNSLIWYMTIHRGRMPFLFSDYGYLVTFFMLFIFLWIFYGPIQIGMLNIITYLGCMIVRVLKLW